MKIRHYLAALSLFGIFTHLQAQQAQQERKTPIMGWSSWNTYRININSDLIKSQAKAAVDLGLRDVGYTYINTDDGFFGFRDSVGNLVTHPQRFPEGLSSMVDYIHSLGMKAGIYSDAGANTCGSIWDKDPNGINVGLYGHTKQDAEYFFNKLGFDFIKIDYCGAGQELNLDEKTQYTTICDTLRNTSKHPININICRWAFPGTWVRDVAESWRISSDISPKWWSIKYIMEKNMYLSAYAGNGRFNDMDMLEIGAGLPANEEDVHFALWCLMSSPLLIGCDLQKIPERSLKLLKNTDLIALNQDSLGLQAHVIKYEGTGYILAKDLKEKLGRERAVAFYNPTDTTVNLSANLLEMGYKQYNESKKKLQVRDLLLQKDLKPIKDSIKVILPPHSVKIYRINGERQKESKTYQAEWAFLPEYNDLPKAPKTKNVGYESDSIAEGRMVVRYAGGRKGNTINWDEVYSENGGKYTLRVRYRADKFRSIGLKIDETDYGVVSVSTDKKADKFDNMDFKVTLKKGYNKVELYSILTWLPDIDCISIIPD